MEDRNVPYIVYEGTIARFERTIKRLIIAITAIVMMLFISNVAWLYVWNQYDFSTEEITIDTQDEGNTAYMGAGASGVINNGIEGNGQEEDGN